MLARFNYSKLPFWVTTCSELCFDFSFSLLSSPLLFFSVCVSCKCLPIWSVVFMKWSIETDICTCRVVLLNCSFMIYVNWFELSFSVSLYMLIKLWSRQITNFFSLLLLLVAFGISKSQPKTYALISQTQRGEKKINKYVELKLFGGDWNMCREFMEYVRIEWHNNCITCVSFVIEMGYSHLNFRFLFLAHFYQLRQILL